MGRNWGGEVDYTVYINTDSGNSNNIISYYNTTYIKNIYSVAYHYTKYGYLKIYVMLDTTAWQNVTSKIYNIIKIDLNFFKNKMNLSNKINYQLIANRVSNSGALTDLRYWYVEPNNTVSNNILFIDINFQEKLITSTTIRENTSLCIDIIGFLNNYSYD